MNYANPLIKEAYRLYRKRRYRDSIVILEKLVSSGGKDAYVHFLLAVNYLLDGKLNRIDEHLRKSGFADKNYLPAIQLDLFLSLKSAENAANVLSKYLDAYQRFPADSYIRKGMTCLREADNFPDLQMKARLNDFVEVPRPAGIKCVRTVKLRGRRSYRMLKTLLLVMSGIFVLAAITYGVYSNRNSIIGMLSVKAGKEHADAPRELEMITIEKDRYDLIDKIKKEKTPVFYYSNDEIYQDFNKARTLIKNEKHNEALIILNKLLNSNASFSVKERADFLRRFIINVEDRDCTTATFGEVSRNTYLYQGMMISWKGKVANLKRRDGRLLFHLLTEYRQHDMFSGIAEVYSEKDYSTVKNGDLVEVRALLSNTVGDEKRIYLVAKSILLMQ